jgi:alpha-tubulin suppressor-like RCC1 family protein
MKARGLLLWALPLLCAVFISACGRGESPDGDASDAGEVRPLRVPPSPAPLSVLENIPIFSLEGHAFPQMPTTREPLALEINRNVIHAGRYLSAAITNDGAVWVWGADAPPAPTRTRFAMYVTSLASQGDAILYDNDENPIIPKEVFDESGKSLGWLLIDDQNIWVVCAETDNLLPFSSITPTDLEGNRITLADMPAPGITYDYRTAPHRFHTDKNIASLFADRNTARLYAITEEAELWFIWDDAGTEPYRMGEGIVDMASGIHMTDAIQTRITHGVLAADGRGYKVDEHGTWIQAYNSHLHQPLWPRITLAGIQAFDYGSAHFMALMFNGELWAWGGNEAVGIPPGFNELRIYPNVVWDNVKSIAAGRLHSMALTRDGRLYTWGAGDRGQLGHDHRTPMPPNGNLDRGSWTPAFVMGDVIYIAAGEFHSLAITSGGDLWAWGCNQYGQLGNGTTETSEVPILIKENVIAVSAGYGHTLALTKDGTLYAWGNNARGQLGDGTNINRHSPEAIMTGVMLP